MPIYLDKIARIESDSGFSLLEILVVLAIMSIMMVLVGTRMTSAIEATRFYRMSENAVADIQTLRVRSMLNQYEHIVVPPSQEAPTLKAWQDIKITSYDIPPDWTADGDIIRISKHGTCSGGVISFTGPAGRKVIYKLAAPSCTAERVI